jgi:hypothetical protein
MNNTTCFVCPWPLPLWGFRHLLAIVSPYKPLLEALLGLTLNHMSLPQTGKLRLLIHFTAGPCLRLTLSHTLTQRGTSTLLPEPERHGFTPKDIYYSVLLGVDRTPFLPPEAGLNSNLGFYQSDELVSKPFWVPLCDRTCLLSLLGERLPLLGSTWSGCSWQGWPSWWAGDTEPATRR